LTVKVTDEIGAKHGFDTVQSVLDDELVGEALRLALVITKLVSEPCYADIRLHQCLQLRVSFGQIWRLGFLISYTFCRPFSLLLSLNVSFVALVFQHVVLLAAGLLVPVSGKLYVVIKLCLADGAQIAIVTYKSEWRFVLWLVVQRHVPVKAKPSC
jgi:hypothetical protein